MMSALQRRRAVVGVTALLVAVGVMAGLAHVASAAPAPLHAEAARERPTPTRFQLVYVHGTDTTVTSERLQSLRHTALEADRWFARQMGGASLRFDESLPGVPSVVVIPAPMTRRELSGQEDYVYDTVIDWQAQGLIDPEDFPVVFLEASQTYDACAWEWEDARRAYISIPIYACHYRPSTTLTFPKGASYLLAHEVGHALGAVSPNAPHGTRGWHIRGDVRDLMYGGWKPMDWRHLALDPGHDDYYLTGRDDLNNIEDSPLLEP